MPSDRRRNCRNCGKHESEVGAISWRGKCGACGVALQHAATDDLHYHRGPTLLKWRRQMAQSIGAVLVDDLPPPD